MLLARAMASTGDSVLCHYCRQHNADDCPDGMHAICFGEGGCWDWSHRYGWHAFFNYHFARRALAWQRMLGGHALMTLVMPEHHEQIPEVVKTNVYYFLWLP